MGEWVIAVKADRKWIGKEKQKIYSERQKIA